MDIDKEVKKYEKKRTNLLNSLKSRLLRHSKAKSKAVKNINTVIDDLNTQKNDNLNEIQKVSMTLNSLK